MCLKSNKEHKKTNSTPPAPAPGLPQPIQKKARIRKFGLVPIPALRSPAIVCYPATPRPLPTAHPHPHPSPNLSATSVPSPCQPCVDSNFNPNPNKLHQRLFRTQPSPSLARTLTPPLTLTRLSSGWKGAKTGFWGLAPAGWRRRCKPRWARQARWARWVRRLPSLTPSPHSMRSTQRGCRQKRGVPGLPQNLCPARKTAHRYSEFVGYPG